LEIGKDPSSTAATPMAIARVMIRVYSLKFPDGKGTIDTFLSRTYDRADSLDVSYDKLRESLKLQPNAECATLT
jgi:hypothetical protein